MKNILLISLSVLLLSSCEANRVMASTDHLVATATGISVSAGGGFSVNQLRVKAPDNPKVLFKSAELRVYRDCDNKAGFTSPPDQLVNHKKADSPIPTNDLEVGSLTTSNAEHGVGNAFELIVVDENDFNHTFSGSF